MLNADGLSKVASRWCRAALADKRLRPRADLPTLHTADNDLMKIFAAKPTSSINELERTHSLDYCQIYGQWLRKDPGAMYIKLRVNSAGAPTFSACGTIYTKPTRHRKTKKPLVYSKYKTPIFDLCGPNPDSPVTAAKYIGSV